MVEQMNIWNIWAFAGLIIIMAFPLIISIVTSFRHRKWQKQQNLQRAAWDEEQKRQQEEKTKQMLELKQRMTAQFKSSGWLNRAADTICQEKRPATRIELWENQLILETEESCEFYPLDMFGLEQPLSKIETYYANMALFDVIRTRTACYYYLEDNGLHCEIIRIR